jgi:hypothetical protein
MKNYADLCQYIDNTPLITYLNPGNTTEHHNGWVVFVWP